MLVRPCLPTGVHFSSSHYDSSFRILNSYDLGLTKSLALKSPVVGVKAGMCAGCGCDGAVGAMPHAGGGVHAPQGTGTHQLRRQSTR